MPFSDNELTDLRRHCGYPAYGIGNGGFSNWRFYQAYGMLEYRLQRLSGAEESVACTYIQTLATLEHAVTDASATLDTDSAAAWTRNAREVAERTRLFDDWRRRLCGFLGVPPGPSLGDTGTRLVV
jgi:hypothetical protein